MSPEVLLFCKQTHALCKLALSFMRSFEEDIEHKTDVPEGCSEADGLRPQTLRGYYSRTAAWMASIEKLADPGDIQALTVPARSLFEAQIDLVLLEHGREKAYEKLFAWERSAVLDQAQKVSNFYKGTAPADYVRWGGFLRDSEADVIKKTRHKWWSGKHPPRWTGNHTGEDASRADDLSEGTLNLRRQYELEFGPTCWAIHGSGLVGFRSVSPDFIPGQCGMRMQAVQSLALGNLRLILDALGILHGHKFDEFESRAKDMLLRLVAEEP